MVLNVGQRLGQQRDRRALPASAFAENPDP
jgi:hypothetical protein